VNDYDNMFRRVNFLLNSYKSHMEIHVNEYTRLHLELVNLQLEALNDEFWELE
jgi:hypothetical protein